MKKSYFFLLVAIIINLLIVQDISSQTEISGTLFDKSGTPIIGANIFLKDTYDGGTSDLDGKFAFNTNEKGNQIITITYLGYASLSVKIDVESYRRQEFTMRESVQTLDAVEITASTFTAGGNSKVAVLKPLDMVTTAGSNGDVIAAIQTLPGNQANPEDGRLFVRGGDARETQIFIDGMRVFSPYNSSIAIENTPARGRFSPFLFQGVTFSSGGYGSEYGQALSGILDMKTVDAPDENQTDLSLMSIGVGISNTTIKGNHSLTMNASYIHFGLYHALVTPRLDFQKPIQGFAGELVYRYKTEKGIFKSYLAGDFSNNALRVFDISSSDSLAVSINNKNYYSNTTYSTMLSDHTSLMVGTSIGINHDDVQTGPHNIDASLQGLHNKVLFKTAFQDNWILRYGAELFYQKDDFDYVYDEDLSPSSDEIGRFIPATFVETDYYISSSLAFKLGGRFEYNSILNTYNVNPRITLAQKLGQSSQLSLAYGSYHQEADSRFLYYRLPSLLNEKSTHYLVNFNHKSNNYIFRVESYYKEYDDLIQYQGSRDNYENITNDGDGYAYGLDVFWRANQVIKNVDFWISYSWLENRRNYLNYPVASVTRFSTRHNFSLVTKTWIDALQSQLGITYSFASGRPYTDPNQNGFLNQRSKPYHNISMSWSYLISDQKILFLSASNIFNIQNQFGYRYADTPGQNGIYAGEPILPSENQFLFAGFFVTFSKDESKNQLDKL